MRERLADRAVSRSYDAGGGTVPERLIWHRLLFITWVRRPSFIR